jgi:hypothetical protein
MEKTYFKEWVIKDWLASVAKHCIKDEFKKKDTEADMSLLAQRVAADTIH